MPNYEIPLFEPVVLNGVINKLPTKDTLQLINRIQKRSTLDTTFTWDVIQQERTMAEVNSPNAEANVVKHLPRSQITARLAYSREKKVLQPTHYRWIRAAGELTRRAGEAEVMRELQDLKDRQDTLVEWSLWQALQGSLTFTYPRGGATVTTDYQFLPSQNITVSTPWASATPMQIRDDIVAMQRLVERQGRVRLTESWATPETIDLIFDAFVTTNGTNDLMSDRMKDAFYTTGVLPGFLGMDWRTMDSVYEDRNGTLQKYLPNNKIVMANLSEGRPFELVEGPSADWEAPEGHTGRWVTSWIVKDPSSRAMLNELSFMPIITRPENIASLTVGTLN